MAHTRRRSGITFDRSVFADALAQAQLLDHDDFAQYGLVGQRQFSASDHDSES